DFVRDGTRLALAEMLRAGITCFADLSLHPEEAARAAAAAHVRAAIALPVSEAPTPWAESATAHLARAERLWDEYRPDPRLARHGASVVSCPQADLRLGARVPVVARGVDRGALGTDSPAAAGALDVLTEARTAALVCGVDAAQALRMATLGGAAALGLAARIGSLEPGKAADLACSDLGGLRR